MSNFIASTLIVAVVAIPTVAIAKASKFRISSVLNASKRAVSFDPRHPALSYVRDAR